MLYIFFVFVIVLDIGYIMGKGFDFLVWLGMGSEGLYWLKIFRIVIVIMREI